MLRKIEIIAGDGRGDPGEQPGKHTKTENQETKIHPEFKSQQV